ncbi:YolD-like family protein [Bacillus sp. Y1]|nr:YolD-like family protein [Bacillus sp. Y1]AYA77316.1 YolD-like family protein [Bacillus sp. Y1]
MIKDRGTKKWQGFFMTEHTELLRELNTEYNFVKKPIVDEYQMAEFDERICYAMEYALPIKFTIWEAGKTAEVVGRVHYVDVNAKQVRLADTRINMADVIAVEVVD